MEMPRSRSMSIQSDTVPRRPSLPCTAPARATTRACRARASVSVDLPASGWLITAKERRRAASVAASEGAVRAVAVAVIGSVRPAASRGATSLVLAWATARWPQRWYVGRCGRQESATADRSGVERVELGLGHELVVGVEADVGEHR